MSYKPNWIADETQGGQPSSELPPAPGELGQLRDLLAQLGEVDSRAELLDVLRACLEGTIGASSFGVLERPSGRGAAVLLLAVGDEGVLRQVVDHRRVLDTLRLGTSHIRRVDSRGTAASPEVPDPLEPIASVPLWGTGGSACGALVLVELRPPQRELDRQDHRVLALLASEAGRLLSTLPREDGAEGGA